MFCAELIGAAVPALEARLSTGTLARCTPEEDLFFRRRVDDVLTARVIGHVTSTPVGAAVVPSSARAPLLANVAFAGVDAAFQTAAHCLVFLHAASVLAPPATRDATVAFVLSATALLVTELRRGRTPDRVTGPSEDLAVRIGEVIHKGNLPVSLKSGLKRVWNQTSGGQFYADFTSASGAGVRAKHKEEFEAATGDLLAAAVRKDIAIHGLRACGLASCDKREARGSQQFLFVLD